MVTSGKDILNAFSIKSNGIPQEKIVKGETKEEQQIIDLLQNESLAIDQLARQTTMHIGEIGTLLSLMEMKGMIIQHNGIFSIAT